VPSRLTADEISTIKAMVESPDYRHVPTGRLAILAQRIGKVFASPTTWYKLIRERGWRRPRQRLYPATAKQSVRATRPDEFWHLDTTLIKLLDHTKVYLHAVIDNFSRKILAWRVCETFEFATTVTILREAASQAVSAEEVPTAVADAGVENLNGGVDELIESGWLRRVVALKDVTFSNSMIEAWWRILKHQWLYLNTLDTLAAVARLVAFYGVEHNSNINIPHSAFRGETPDEMYTGRGADVVEELSLARRQARLDRAAANRAQSCSICQRDARIQEFAPVMA
jgi:transposase InsO family protein